MVEPVSLTLGAIAAALVAKVADKTAEQAVEGGAGAVSRLVAWLKDRFVEADEDGGAMALARVEEVPDSPSRLSALADVVNRRAEADREFRLGLMSLVEDAHRSGVDVGSLTQTSFGDQNVQASGVVRSEINVTYGQPRHSG